MRISRLVAFCLCSVTTVVILAPRAEAARAFDIEISGPGLPEPAVFRWDAMAGTVSEYARSIGAGPDDFVGFWHEIKKPRGSLGPAYQLKVSSFIPTGPRQQLGIEFWTYYPTRGALQMSENEWRQPLLALRTLWNHAIPGEEPVIPDPDPRGSASRTVALALIPIAAALSLIVVRRRMVRRHETTML